ncbi:hypothetical protein OX284_004870 [Flavobacterium sp. SUN046]|nr:hypothetical protein [Flavobacterium sp. SUN046]MEC4048753.1 hypothetical protein [Flavobacterium sp. SUN046]
MKNRIYSKSIVEDEFNEMIDRENEAKANKSKLQKIIYEWLKKTKLK